MGGGGLVREGWGGGGDGGEGIRGGGMGGGEEWGGMGLCVADSRKGEREKGGDR